MKYKTTLEKKVLWIKDYIDPWFKSSNLFHKLILNEIFDTSSVQKEPRFFRLKHHRHSCCASLYQRTDKVLCWFRKFDWGSYVISNYYPKAIRDDFLAIQYFNIELMRIPEGVREQSLALQKLEFWTESLNDIYRVLWLFRIILPRNLYQ